ncbi:MAG: M28 family peptidase, partial [Bacteroidia bacterium]|nr:M28 family peptidase [Bacteroidia bacterium]
KKKVSIISGTVGVSDWSTNWRMKNNEAKARGIAILLIVDPELQKSMADNSHRITSTKMQLAEDSKAPKFESPLVIYISEKMGNEILAKSKKSINAIKTKLQKKKTPDNFELSALVKLKTGQGQEKLSAENVLGYVEGSDLKSELVIVTAHYDHLGKHDGVVYNGADDDGSGTVAVMQLARAFAEAKKQGKGPRRSMLFMCVAGEEKGLLGSDYYSRHPVFDLKKTVADLNIDMIGRLDEKHKNNSNYIYIIGSDMLSTALHSINENANKTYVNLELDYLYNSTTDANRYYYRSDHYNFAKHNIPVIFYFNGVHADYHKETDEVQKIDFKKMEKIASLVFFTAWELSNRDERIKVDK